LGTVPDQPGFQLVFASEQGQGFDIIKLRAQCWEDASTWERALRGLLGRDLLRGALDTGSLQQSSEANKADDENRMMAWYQNQKNSGGGAKCEMSITVSMADGSSFPVLVEKKAGTILDVKRRVEEQTGLTVKQQAVMHEGGGGGDMVLGNDKVLHKCGVGEGSTLVVLLNSVMCKEWWDVLTKAPTAKDCQLAKNTKAALVSDNLSEGYCMSGRNAQLDVKFKHECTLSAVTVTPLDIYECGDDWCWYFSPMTVLFKTSDDAQEWVEAETMDVLKSGKRPPKADFVKPYRIHFRDEGITCTQMRFVRQGKGYIGFGFLQFE
jgi:hypothetical protein